MKFKVGDWVILNKDGINNHAYELPIKPLQVKSTSHEMGYYWIGVECNYDDEGISSGFVTNWNEDNFDLYVKKEYKNNMEKELDDLTTMGFKDEEF